MLCTSVFLIVLRILPGPSGSSPCLSLPCSVPRRLVSDCPVNQPMGGSCRRWMGRERLGTSFPHRSAVVTVQPFPAPTAPFPAPSSAVPSASCCSSPGAVPILLQSTPPQSSKVHSVHCESPSHPVGTLTCKGVAKVQEGGPFALGLVHVQTLPRSVCLRWRPH